MMSMAVSLCLLGLLISLYVGLFYGPDASPSAALRLIVRHKVSLTQFMPTSYRQRIATVPHVAAISNWQWFGGTYKDARDPRNFFGRFVVDPADVFKVRPEMLSMPEEQRNAFIRQRTGAIASSSLVRKHHWKLGERITLVGDIFPVTLEFKLVGVWDEPNDDETFLFQWDCLEEALHDNPGYRDLVGAFLIIVDAPEHVPGVAKTIDAMFANSPYPTKSESEKEMALSFVAFLGNLRLFLVAVCAAVTFTILLVSANTIAMAVRERTRETAILRTLGYTPSEILVFILGEATLIGALGGIAGAGLSTLLAMWLRKTLAESAGFPFPLLPPMLVGALVLAAIVIAVSSAAVPAYFASRKNVVESLRFAG